MLNGQNLRILKVMTFRLIINYGPLEVKHIFASSPICIQDLSLRIVLVIIKSNAYQVKNGKFLKLEAHKQLKDKNWILWILWTLHKMGYKK